jgi:leucyl aminopeptidase
VIQYRNKSQFDKHLNIILVTEEQVKKGAFPQKHALKPALDARHFKGELKEIFPVVVGKKIFLVAGVGTKDQSPTNVRIAVRHAMLSGLGKGIKDVELTPHEQNDVVLRAAVEGVVLGSYVWDKYKSKKEEVKSVTLVSSNAPLCKEAELIALATNTARDLANENADVKTSDFLEKKIRSLIKGKSYISFELLNKKEMKAKGLGLHLAVNQGSKNEPKLVIVKYKGGKSHDPYTALVGKGMTYDTGGLNIKPTGSMETMRMDMSGTAAVIGTLKAAIDTKLKKNVLFVCAIAENVTDARSYKPGDVIVGYAGKSVEIGNTDAEGRLVLADAISYVIKNYKPKRLIDIATLTGACVVALGHEYTGLCTTDESLSRDLVHASNETDDRVWRLPIFPELKDHVKSRIADIKNTGLRGAAGMISAAEFLRQFAEGVTWAHLDIAGTAFVDGEGRWYFGHGATGAGVRLLSKYLRDYA